MDMGALGIFPPFINTAEEARIGAQAMRYPPEGTRGYGPARASRYGFDENYFESANQEMLYLPNIEHEDAVRNIDAILAVEGVDSFVVGVCDLSISLGVPMDFEHPKFRDAIKTVTGAAENHGKPAGIGLYGDPTEPGLLQRFVDQGFRLLLVGGDEWFLTRACKAVMLRCSELRARSSG